ncbi:hypothetical protein PIB30_066312 [Stylosanthes scabra]|uniref:Uncharacterized protein n=1 Tax=Stylosanthes scabra TaxID=79078 RepID=A0ABU6WMZ8_9FABA|nr:hypothetical protein [Stylosanthes scabra]
MILPEIIFLVPVDFYGSLGFLLLQPFNLRALSVETIQITPETFFRFLHNRVQVQAGFRKSPVGCEVLHEAVGQSYGKGFALYGIRSIYEQHLIFEGIQVMLQVCSSVIRLDLNGIPKLLRKIFC